MVAPQWLHRGKAIALFIVQLVIGDTDASKLNLYLLFQVCQFIHRFAVDLDVDIDTVDCILVSGDFGIKVFNVDGLLCSIHLLRGLVLAADHGLIAYLLINQFPRIVFLERGHSHGERGAPHAGYRVQGTRGNLSREVLYHKGSAHQAGLLGMVTGEVNAVGAKAALNFLVVDRRFGFCHVGVVFHLFGNGVDIHIDELAHQVIAQKDGHLVIFYAVDFVPFAHDQGVDVILLGLRFVDKIVRPLYRTGFCLGAFDLIDHVCQDVVIAARQTAVVFFEGAHVLDFICTEHGEGAAQGIKQPAQLFDFLRDFFIGHHVGVRRVIAIETEQFLAVPAAIDAAVGKAELNQILDRQPGTHLFH